MSYYVLQASIYVIISIVEVNYFVYNPSYYIPFYESSLSVLQTIFFAFFIILLINVVIYCKRASSVRIKEIYFDIGLFHVFKSSVVPISLFFIFYIFCNIIGSSVYVLRILYSFFQFFPFIFGVIWSSLLIKKKSFISLYFIVNFVYFSLLGARGYALFPMIFFFIGRLLFLFVNKRIFSKKVFLIILSAIFFLGFYMPLISAYRVMYGRGNITSESIFELASLSDSDDLIDDNSDSYRLLNNPMLSVCYLLDSKQLKPRKFQYLDAEVFSLFNMSNTTDKEITSSRLSKTNAKYGIGLSNKFGYYSNEFNSVEFNVFSDAYYNLGSIGVIIYFVITFIFLCSVESILIRSYCFLGMFSIYSIIYLSMSSILIMHIYPLIYSVRIILFRLIFAMAIIFFIKILIKRR